MIQIQLFALMILFFGLQASQSSGRTISFSRNCGEVWVADENGENSRFLCKGWDPEIDPSGSFVAYTLSANSSRSIEIMGIRDARKISLKSISGTNSFGPKWNQTGDRLFFSWFDTVTSRWHIGTVKAFSGTEFHLLDGLNFTSDTCTGLISSRCAKTDRTCMSSNRTVS